MQASRHEHPSKYAKGGFCPIELGDRIADRFTVLHKLGYGGFGTVWLVRDDAQRHGRRYVALKVLAAAYSAGDGPSVAVRRLREYERATGRGLFVLELERFFYASANGRHLCQVFPVLGPSLAALNGDKFLLRPSFVRPFSRQLVRAVDTMHSIGVCHGDLTLGNVVVALDKSLDSLSEKQLEELLGPPRTAPLDPFSHLNQRPSSTSPSSSPPLPPSISSPSPPSSSPCSTSPSPRPIPSLSARSSSPSLSSPSPQPSPSTASTSTRLSAPRYAVEPVRLTRLPSAYLSDRLCVIDFDQAYPAEDPPRKLSQIPAPYLAPENIFALANGPPADVWALGCVLFSLRSPWLLFQDFLTCTPAATVSCMCEILGDLPQQWRTVRFHNGYPVHESAGQGVEYETFEHMDGQCDSFLEDEVRAIREPRDPGTAHGGEDGIGKFCLPVPRFDRNNPRGQWEARNLKRLDEDDATLFADLLGKVFTYDPQKRLTAKQILAHPWLTETYRRHGDAPQPQSDLAKEHSVHRPPCRPEETAL